MKIPRTKRYSIYKKLVLIEEQRRIDEEGKDRILFFEPDGREHYVYRVTDSTRSEKDHYYGSHTPHKGKIYTSLIDEFWTYRTSSKYNVLDENKKEQYKIKIINVFDNPADKMIYEAFLHQYFNVKLSSKFWNESNQTPFGYDTTGKSFNVGRKQTKKNKEAVSRANRNKIVVYDDSNNIIRINTNDKRYLSGQYKNLTQGKTKAKDLEGNIVMVDCETYHNSSNFRYTREQIAIYDKVENKNKLVTNKEFQENDHYMGIAEGKVNVKDGFNNKFQVSKYDPRYLSGEFVHVRKGIKYDRNSPEYKEAYIERDFSGSKNPKALKINIFDEKNNLRFECHGNIREVIKDNDLPNNLIGSYRNDAKPLYTSKRQLTFAKKKGWESFQGWYAKIVD